MIGQTAGLIAFLLTKQHNIISIVCYDNKNLYESFGYKCYDSIYDERFIDGLLKSRLLLCVHGREIVPVSLLRKVRYTANVHPFYEKYKGKSPIKRALIDNCIDADVTSHEMTENVDNGKVIAQHKLTISGDTVEKVYNELYPTYAKVIDDTINFFLTEDKQTHCII
jgi:methionyl-tRNA formyltransferase